MDPVLRRHLNNAMPAFQAACLGDLLEDLEDRHAALLRILDSKPASVANSSNIPANSSTPANQG